MSSSVLLSLARGAGDAEAVRRILENPKLSPLFRNSEFHRWLEEKNNPKPGGTLGARRLPGPKGKLRVEWFFGSSVNRRHLTAARLPLPEGSTVEVLSGNDCGGMARSLAMVPAPFNRGVVECEIPEDLVTSSQALRLRRGDGFVFKTRSAALKSVIPAQLVGFSADRVAAPHPSHPISSSVIFLPCPERLPPFLRDGRAPPGCRKHPSL